VADVVITVAVGTAPVREAVAVDLKKYVNVHSMPVVTLWRRASL